MDVNCKKIVMVRTNSINKESRGIKIIKTFQEEGNSLCYLYWNRELSTSVKKPIFSEEIQEIKFSPKLTWGPKILLLIPFWWFFVFIQLMINDWDLAYAMKFDTLPPTVIAGIIRKKPVIYDMFDTCADERIYPVFIRQILIGIDKIFMRLSSCVILVDENQIIECNGIPNQNVVVIYDSPEDISQENVIFGNWKKNNFCIFYGGTLFKVRRLNIDKMVDAVKNLDNVTLTIAGYGDLKSEIEQYSKKYPDKIQFLGELSPSDIIHHSLHTDLLFVLRDPIVPVNKYICGNKLLESMMCGKPILVNKDTSTAQKVIENNCGLVVDANNTQEITSAIEKMKNNIELCNVFSKNARKAYENKYGWKLMQYRLIKVTNDIFTKNLVKKS